MQVDKATLKAALVQALPSHGKAKELIDQALITLPFICISEDQQQQVSLNPKKLSRGSAGEGAACILVFECPNTPVADENQYQKVSRESSTQTAIKNAVKVCFAQIAQTFSQNPKKESDLFRFVAQSTTESTF